MSSCCVSEISFQKDGLNRSAASQATERSVRAPDVQRPPPSLARMAATLKLWRSRVRERRQLRNLSDRALHDMGITHDRAREEWRKPFWR